MEVVPHAEISEAQIHTDLDAVFGVYRGTKGHHGPISYTQQPCPKDGTRELEGERLKMQ